VIAGRFAVEALARRGGMGSVFRARDQLTGDLVALKIMHDADEPALVDRFLREAQLLYELRHPNIVRYVAHGLMSSGEPYLAMEWLEGVDLSARLRSEALTLDESVRLGARVADALAVAHGRGVIHRDVKPANLFLTADGVKLLDFGVARIGRGHDTRTGVRIGTPRYMAPEQARGVRELDPRVDLFALGAVLYECVTRVPAFDGDDELAVLTRILFGETRRISERVPDVDPALDDLVAQLLERDPVARPGTAAEVARQLEEIAARGAPASLRPLHADMPPVLGGDERRLLSVVLLGGGAVKAAGDPDPTPLAAPRHRVARAVRQAGGESDQLADGSLVAVLRQRAAATDQAAAAAHLALVLHDLSPASPVALATGHGVVAGRLPLGEVIDRAVALVRARAGTTSRSVAIDDVTAGLLDSRWEVAHTTRGLTLVGERKDTLSPRRTLLGRPSMFVGRERELLHLNGTFDECIEESVARAILVTAPAGMGKSRLVSELLQAAERRVPGLVPWIGRADSLRAGTPFGLIARALRDLAGILDGEDEERQRERLIKRVTQNLPAAEGVAVSEFLGELVGVPFPDEDRVQLRAARTNAQIMGDQMRAAFLAFLRAETDLHPVLLILEDLHWGDLPTVRLIDTALRTLADRPFMVVAVARPEVHDLFPDLWSERAVTVIRLGPLSPRAADKLVRQALADASEGARAKLIEQSAGNAFYLEELIRASAEGKRESLPETVLAMVGARLERLPAEARRVLRAASVFGQLFWSGGLTALLGDVASQSGTREWLADLEAREIVERRAGSRFPGQEELSFRHALVRDAAYAMLTDGDRALGHRLAGAWLESLGEREAGVLAEHFERGGDPEHAVRWYRRAAELALDANDLGAVVTLVGRGLGCGAAGEDRGALRFVEAMAQRWLGDYSAAEAAGAEALATLPHGSVAWYRAVRPWVSALAARGKQQRAVPLVEEARAFDGVPNADMVIAWGSAAADLFYGGFYDVARMLVERIERARGQLDAEPVAAGYLDRACSFRANFSGDLAGAIPLSESAARAFERAGDRRNHSLERMNSAMGYVSVGAYADGERGLRHALELAEPLALPYLNSAIKQALMLALMGLGQLEPARALGVEVLAVFDAIGERRMVASTRLYLAQILARLDRSAEAMAEADAAVLAAEPYRPIAVEALAVRARLHLAAGDEARAMIDARAAMDELTQLKAIDEGEALVRLTFAEVLDETGHADEARRALTEARDRLLQQAARIGDAALRKSFLSNVSEHATTFALSARWGV
jgi:tetratricopeptide (TPR) repeat protein